MAITFSLAEYGKTLSTRPRGAAVRSNLLDAIGEQSKVVLDCDGVLALSYSFADEFAGKLAQGEPVDRAPLAFEIVGASDNVLAALTTAIDRRTAAAA